MTMRTVLAIATVLILATPVVAQNRTAPQPTNGWHEQTAEMGVAQALYQDLMDGERRKFEAKFYLNTHYNHRYGPDKGVTYFLFALDMQKTPLVGSIMELVDGATGKAIPIYKKETDDSGKLIKWFVDAVNMPPPDRAVVLRASVGSTGEGQYQAGALLQPFNYRWESVNMASGTPAQLYIFTQYGVNGVTEEGCSGPLCAATEVLPTPAWGLVGAVAALAVAGGVARRRA